MRYIALVLLLSSPAFAFGKKAPTPKPSVSPSPSSQTSPSPSPSPAPSDGYFKQFTPVKNYTAAELANLVLVDRLAYDTLQSECFKDFILKRKLIQTNGKTNAEVAEHLKTSRLTVPVVMYYTSKGVIGYRSPPSPVVHTNRGFHGLKTEYTNRTRASNLTHERSHVLNYGHDYKRTSRRPYSVPYSINAAFDSCVVCKTLYDCHVK